MLSTKPTIFAPATAAGKAPIAVVRVSGPAASEAIRALTGREPPPARQAGLRRLSAPRALWVASASTTPWCSGFPDRASETGEDMAEFHLHGGRAVVAAILAALAAVPGLTPAGPGAFTRQAFDNGKLDLTAAEAIADLVEAETAAQRRQALRQMDGALARLYEGWRADLLMLLARLEAAIDFPEEDLPPNLAALNLQGIYQITKRDR